MMRFRWAEPPARVRLLYSMAIGVKVLRPGWFTFNNNQDDPTYVWEPPPPEPPQPQRWLDVWELADGSLEQVNRTEQPAP